MKLTEHFTLNELTRSNTAQELGLDNTPGPDALQQLHRTAQMLERAKDDLRIMREPMLSAVTGMGWEASEAGDATLVQEARNIRNALRDITDDHALNAAQTYEEMRAAGVAAYRRIAAGASPAFAATFKEITGA